jgi:hypothetical protein
MPEHSSPPLTRPLKLMALDEEDLNVISACFQDAVVKQADMAYLAQDKCFALVANRFVWEQARKGEDYQRRRAGLHIRQVQSVKSRNINTEAREAVLSLLAITFEADNAPSGHVYLHFSEDKTVCLQVECLEVAMKDLGAMWTTDHKPQHPLDVSDKMSKKSNG